MTIGKMTMALALTALGCGSSAGNADVTRLSESEQALLFEDWYSPTGAIRVYEGPSGLSVHVVGGIGADSEAAIGQLLASGNLQHVYLELHPEARKAPEALIDIDRRLAEQLADAIARGAESKQRADVERSEGDDLVPKSITDFNNAACKTFATTSARWVPTLCKYRTSVSLLAQTDCPSCGPWRQTPNDRAFVWNESSRDVQIRVVRIEGTATLDSGFGWITPTTWGWYSPSFNLSNVYADVDWERNEPPDTANIGITHHNWEPIIR